LNTDLVLTSQRVVTPDGTRPASIIIRGGKIVEVSDVTPGDEDDVTELVIMPGLVDTHVHINEPGRSDWEGFTSATRAAAAGGVTSLIDMPLNSIPATTSVPAFNDKLSAARGRCFVDVGFWGGVVPGNREQLAPLYEAGVFGFKAFLVPSGVAEFEAITLPELRTALHHLESIGAPLLVHAELPEPILEATARLERAKGSRKVYDTYLRSRPAAAEDDAIAAMIELAVQTGAHVHIVHLASASALPMLREARSRGARITVETCPHYLYFAAEDIPDGATQFKCAPPIRDAANREGLWGALGEGVIDFVVSDHSPSPPEMKKGNFFDAWGGIASLQLRLPVMCAGAQTRGHDFDRLTRWLCSGPARLAGLKNKGAIAPGFDADFVIWDPDWEQLVQPDLLLHRHKQTPYLGLTLPGVVRATYLRGEKIYDGSTVHARATGTLLLRGK
jgi:allantoinase